MEDTFDLQNRKVIFRRLGRNCGIFLQCVKFDQWCTKYTEREGNLLCSNSMGCCELRKLRKNWGRTIFEPTEGEDSDWVSKASIKMLAVTADKDRRNPYKKQFLKHAHSHSRDMENR